MIGYINFILLNGICLMLLWWDVRPTVRWARYGHYLPFLEKFAWYYWIFSVFTIMGYY